MLTALLVLTCTNPDLPRFDYRITQVDAKTYEFRVEKNTTDPWSARSRWGADTTTELIYHETLTSRGNKLQGKRTHLDLSHQAYVTYNYVAQDSAGNFVNKSYVLNCEML